MSRLQRFLCLASLGIVTALPGCDNIDWGGAEVGIVPPPPRAVEQVAEPEGPQVERVPAGPILYYVRPDNEVHATVVPLGEITARELRPLEATASWEAFGTQFIGRHLREGTELSLFRGGARVGTLIVQTGMVPGPEVCPQVPRARGVMELVAGVERDGDFLAMAKPQAPTGLASPLPPEPTPVMRRLAPILAERLLRERRAPLPGNWQRAMAQLRPFPMANLPDAAFAATFLVGDTLAPGPAQEGHSLFFIGEPVPRLGFDTAFVRFTVYAQDGRAAPRLVDFLDWTRNGQVELLLNVYGADQTWFEAVARVNGAWRMVFQNRCPEPPAPTPAPEEAEPVAGAAAPVED